MLQLVTVCLSYAIDCKTFADKDVIELLKSLEPELNARTNSSYIERVSVFNDCKCNSFSNKMGSQTTVEVKEVNFSITTCRKADHPDIKTCNKVTGIAGPCFVKISILNKGKPNIDEFHCA